jgi:RNA-directed DNA polymerase
LFGPAWSKTPGTPRNFMHENRETSETPAVKPDCRSAGEGPGRTARVYVGEESHSGVVPMNHSNKDMRSSAESEEGRPLIKENAGQSNTCPTQSGKGVSQGLAGVRKAAREHKEMKFTALLHHLTIDLLRESFYALKRKAAPGVDGVTWQEYESGWENRLVDLHGRVHRGVYRALPSRRVYIQKEDGRQRPLGVAALEDKIVQQAVVTILNQIYEEDFLGFSYGFRPGRSQHDALDALSYALLKKKVNYILDADIHGFFDNLDKGWMIKFMEHRVTDPRILRLIRKWLKAGVMEEGQWSEPRTGTPQGSVVSPLLANVYLHYSFDLWVNVWRKKWAQGEVVVIRLPMTPLQDSSTSRMPIVSWRTYGNGWPSLGWSYTRKRRAGSNSGVSPKRTGNVEEKGNPRRSTFWASRISAGRTV